MPSSPPTMPSFLLLATLFASLLSTAVAQTWTACNPLEKDDCPRNPALGTSYQANFTDTLNEVIWNITNGQLDYIDGVGTSFAIKERLQSPTIQSHFYIFFGRVEVIMKAAFGRGVVSSIVLQSEDLDEIDWEWVGSDTTHVQTNYFGKGNRTLGDRGGVHEMDAPMDKFHNYTVDWTVERLQWWIDDTLLRTVTYDEALGGKNYPQTPMTVRMGIWPAGDKKNEKGTIEWAGGEIDYSKVPYFMTVKHVRVEDYSSGKEYEYTDRSGNWKSIKVINGTSYLSEEAHKPPPKSLSQKWRELPQGAKIAVYSSAGGVALVGLLVLLFCCVKQRRAGRREFALQESKFTTEQNDMITMQTQWKKKHYQEI
ncbi:extracellular cell wall glucanase Crf1 [Histoplasma ohiense]|nr:extracellular cell wall glucanase Crf1 [Histoplasma ohiense (nom. inval.)]